jgi:hypothetical protein
MTSQGLVSVSVLNPSAVTKARICIRSDIARIDVSGGSRPSVRDIVVM